MQRAYRLVASAGISGIRTNLLLKTTLVYSLLRNTSRNSFLDSSSASSATAAQKVLLSGAGSRLFSLRGGNSDPNANHYRTDIQRKFSTDSNPPMKAANVPEDKNEDTAMSSVSDPPHDNDCWDYFKNPESFSRLTHPGYALSSDPDTHVGGWLAHRVPQEEVEHCWIRNEVASKLTRYDYQSMPLGRPPKILVLYGSLRPTSFSRKMAYEFARLLEELGCDVRTYDPHGLPVRDPSLENLPKVVELRSLTQWSDGHVWCSPEMHGTITGTFKNQIDWIPLNTGSVRPTQGKTCLVGQVNGGSQSFNAVNALRLLARWMRMPCCTNQSSVAKAWKEFESDGRMKDSSFRDRVIDCAEEFAKFTAVMAPVSNDLTDRYSERKEKEKEGRLLTQAEKEVKKTIEESKKT